MLTQSDLDQFTGTEAYHRYLCGLLLTDGARYFAENAHTFWFYDIIATEILRIPNEEFIAITLKVPGDGTCDIIATDGNTRQLFRRHIDFTDAPEGEWKFYLIDKVLMLPSEY